MWADFASFGSSCQNVWVTEVDLSEVALEVRQTEPKPNDSTKFSVGTELPANGFIVLTLLLMNRQTGMTNLGSGSLEHHLGETFCLHQWNG
jgi:hypothetical protein